MNRVQHPTNNDVLRAPPGVPIEEVSALAITRLRFPDGGIGFVSYWMPTAEELARLNAGMPIGILTLGHTQAPMVPLVDGDPGLPQRTT